MSITSDQIRTVGFIHGLADDAADEIEELEKEVAALKAERDAAMKDAERYRWLTPELSRTPKGFRLGRIVRPSIHGARYGMATDGDSAEGWRKGSRERR